MLHTEDPIHQGSSAPNSTVDRGSTVPSALPEMWLPQTMPYKINPDVLHKVAKQVVGLPVEGGELISRATELLSAPASTSCCSGLPLVHKAFRVGTNASRSTSS